MTDHAPDGRYAGLVRAFVGRGGDYYADAFRRIGSVRGIAWQMNPAAFLLGPVWCAARALWGLFWPAFVVEVLAVVLIGIGLFGNLGGDELVRAERLTRMAEERMNAAERAGAEGSALGDSMKRSAEAIAASAEGARARAALAGGNARRYWIGGLALFLGIRLGVALAANAALARRFRRWRGARDLPHGKGTGRAAFAAAMVVFSYPLAVYRFALGEAPDWLVRFPADPATRNAASRAIDGAVRWIAGTFDGVFSAMTAGIDAVLNLMETALVLTPWPIVMAVTLALAWQVSGRRVAIFSAAALAYLGFLGFWEKSMATVALLGTAAFLCILIGIPLGVWCGRRPRAYAAVRPALDFMQTMPAFVYLIPVIAFFGIGKPPGIIATLVFGMPPVIRLTALGIAGVPEAIREAATAYGADRRFLLLKVDLPLAMPSIMTGVNQTLLMCLSMVVIASLIGAKGLGEDVLSALQYAAVGQGILAGVAILMCAMVLDRIVQGRAS
ncbi:MAG: ABC transporter permease subunit [Geminicoccaceae bacterium]|nr:ABC transporter permease subunit [Geminicoccaceae bacterium]